jgi:hypothetical protein
VKVEAPWRARVIVMVIQDESSRRNLFKENGGMEDISKVFLGMES